ncbi:hypothetical protein TKK_0009623 [Trichogramma kaykai]
MSVETPTTSANELCQLCKKANHTAKNCPNLPKCQLCQKVGHTAHDCKRETVCQFCEAKGHGADTCWKLHGKSEGQTLLPPNKTTRLYGIANSPISTLGQTKIKISGIEIPFHAVPNSINMPQDGILGINFLCTNRAILNYSNKTLNINGWIIPVHLSTHRNSCLSIREDIGAEGNLINQSLLPDARVDRSQSINLHGIDGRSISSVGRAMINIYHTDAQFHVLPDEIDLIGDGILGSDFLVQTGAIIDFGKKILQIGKTTAPMYTKREVYTLNTDITELSTTSTCRLSDTFSHGTLTQEIITDFGVENTRDNSELYVFSSSAEGNLCDSGESRMQRLKSIIDTSHLDTSELDSIDSLLQEHSDRFYLEGDELPATNVVEHKITTVDDIPVNQKQYRLPHSLREEVKRQVDDLYKKGIIRHSLSPYSSALWVVPKKARADGVPRWRVVVDFRPLNEKTVPMSHPLPNITDIFDSIVGSVYFTVIDCVSGFHQIKMHPEDAHKTAFSTPDGHFEFVRVPFGLRNAAVEYQRAMNVTFDGLIGKGIFVFMDDVVIYAKSLDEHHRLFNEVMDRLRKANWKLEPDTCEVLKREVSYLGHLISKDGIKPDPKKIEAVKLFPDPKNQKNVRQFIGLAGYCRRFIDHFAKKAKPLTLLLQKDIPFMWDGECERAFDTLKTALCTAPFLQYPDFTDALSRNPPETCEIRAVTRAQTQRANNLIPEPTQQVDSLEFPKGPITRAQARLANQTKKPNPQDIATPRKSDDDSPEIVTTPPDDSPEIVTAPLDQVASDKTTVSDIRPNEDPPEEPKGVDIDNEVRTLTPRPLSLVETKEPLELRQGAIMYFVNSKGLPLDASALGLEKLKRLDYEYHLDPGEVALVKDKRVAYQFVACLTHDGSQKRKFLGLTSQNLKKLANSLGLISWRYSKKFFKTRKLS